MKFKTNIDKQSTSLIGKVSFPQAVLTMFSGREQGSGEIELFNAILVAALDNGIAAPSIFVPRVVASTGNSMNASLAAGVLTIGDFHGGAIEACVKLLNSGKDAQVLVKEVLTRGDRVPGYGHKVYKDIDPRTVAIYEVAERVGKLGKFMVLAQEIEKELETQTGKKLPLNIDGAIAAGMCELGLDARYGKAIFSLSRLPSMAVHIVEEITNEKPYRRLDPSDIEN